MTFNDEVHLATVPAVYRGVALDRWLFRKSVLEAVDLRTPTPFGHPGARREWDLKPDRVVVIVELPRIHRIELSVTIAGIIHSTWRPLSQRPDSNTAEGLVRNGLPKHAGILADVFGYRGQVFFALGGHLAIGPGQIHHYRPWITRGPVELSALTDAATHAEIGREVGRTIEIPDFEPE